jgi:hypothetical protein
MRLFEEYRYFFYITNDRVTPADQIVFSANDRCDQENLIAQLKLIFDSCASVFDVTPLAMGRGSYRSDNPGATPMPGTP